MQSKEWGRNLVHCRDAEADLIVLIALLKQVVVSTGLHIELGEPGSGWYIKKKCAIKGGCPIVNKGKFLDSYLRSFHDVQS